MRLIAYMVLLAAVVTAGPARGADMRVDGYAAMVNDRVITIGDIGAFIQPMEEQLRLNYEGAELQAKIEAAFLKARDSLIEKALILEDFKAQEGQVPDRFVDDHINSIIHDRFADDRAAFLRALAEERMTLEEWREQVTEQLVVMLLRRREVTDRVSISPVRVQEVYAARADKYVVPAQVKLRMIVLNKGETETDATVKHDQATGVLAKLRAGADFAEMATSVSEGSKADRGGDWGWLEPRSLRPELADIVEKLAAGQISDVVETDDAFYVVQVEGRKDSTAVPFETAKVEIEEELRRAEEKRLHDAWMERLRQKFYVKVFPLDVRPVEEADQPDPAAPPASP